MFQLRFLCVFRVRVSLRIGHNRKRCRFRKKVHPSSFPAKENVLTGAAYRYRSSIQRRTPRDNQQPARLRERDLRHPGRLPHPHRL